MKRIYSIKSIDNTIADNIVITIEFEVYSEAVTHLADLIKEGITIISFNIYEWDDEGEEYVNFEVK